MFKTDFGEGGAPDAIGLHAAAQKLLLQTCPLSLRRADIGGGRPEFAQLLSLPGGPFCSDFKSAVLSQDAVLQIGAEFTHRLTQPRHEQDRTEAGRRGVRRSFSQFGADGGKHVANAGCTAAA